jgi:hypothetical protein
MLASTWATSSSCSELSSTRILSVELVVLAPAHHHDITMLRAAILALALALALAIGPLALA